MKESSEKTKKNPPKNKKFFTAFIRCNCDSEVLAVRYDGEYDLLDLCILETKGSFQYKMTWWNRLRYIYQVLKTGQPFSDQIVLEHEQIQELAGFLNKI